MEKVSGTTSNYFMHSEWRTTFGACVGGLRRAEELTWYLFHNTEVPTSGVIYSQAEDTSRQQDQAVADAPVVHVHDNVLSDGDLNFHLTERGVFSGSAPISPEGAVALFIPVTTGPLLSELAGRGAVDVGSNETGDPCMLRGESENELFQHLQHSAPSR